MEASPLDRVAKTVEDGANPVFWPPLPCVGEGWGEGAIDVDTTLYPDRTGLRLVSSLSVVPRPPLPNPLPQGERGPEARLAREMQAKRGLLRESVGVAPIPRFAATESAVPDSCSRFRELDWSGENVIWTSGLLARVPRTDEESATHEDHPKTHADINPGLAPAADHGYIRHQLLPQRRSTAADLSKQILDQNLLLIDFQINECA